MLTAITYNCSPDTLADIAKDEFAEAFENEMLNVFGAPMSIEVSFTPSVRSEVTSWDSDDYEADADLENTWRERINHIARKAFEAACAK